MNEQEQKEFFYSIFDTSMPRLGPGTDESTRKALDIILSADKGIEKQNLRIVDIGCGLGAQTIQLAKLTGSNILAIDNYQLFLDELMRRAEAAGVSDKIEVSCRDMNNMGLDDSSFDLVWSEGAIYIMGIREALEACYKILKPGGFMAYSDMVWFRSDPPKECRDYLEPQCSFLTDLKSNLEIIEKSGYKVIGHFKLPESAWMDPYYIPLENRLRRLREKHSAEKDKLEFIEYIQQEIDLYRKYSSYYGYVFFVLQRS